MGNTNFKKNNCPQGQGQGQGQISRYLGPNKISIWSNFTNYFLFLCLYSILYIQCDAIRWEQFENGYFS